MPVYQFIPFPHPLSCHQSTKRLWNCKIIFPVTCQIMFFFFRKTHVLVMKMDSKTVYYYHILLYDFQKGKWAAKIQRKICGVYGNGTVTKRLSNVVYETEFWEKSPSLRLLAHHYYLKEKFVHLNSPTCSN